VTPTRQQLLDQLALCYVEAALERLLAESEQEKARIDRASKQDQTKGELRAEHTE
jgi:hypothetical protein